MRREVSTSIRSRVSPNGTTRSRASGRCRSWTPFAQEGRHPHIALDPSDRGRLGRLHLHRRHEIGEHHLLDTRPRRATAAPARCSAGTRGSGRRRARPGLRAGSGTCRAGRRRGAARPRSCRCPDRPGRRARREVGADDLVLLGLDRGDDVAQLAGAGRLERGEQRACPTSAGRRRPRCRGLPSRTPRPRCRQRAAPGGEVPAPGQAHRLAAGGPVEGLGDRRPPVDDDGLLVLVRDRETADVEGPRPSSRSIRPKTSAARRSRAGRGGCGRCRDDVTLEAGLVRAAPADLGQPPKANCLLRARSRHSYACLM